MRQFGKILKFEFLGYLKNKAFVGITIFLVIAIVIAMFIPNMIAVVGSDETKEDRPIMLLDCENEEFLGKMVVYFGKLFPDYEVKAADGSTDDIKTAITDEKVECAFVLSEDMKSYTYYVNTLVISDSNQQIAESALVESYKAYAMAENGLSNEQISSIMNISFSGSTECLGANQTQNFIYTYVMIVALYAVIMLYGQLVATNVASEKSSRAMEVLVTSANPMSMMFGKVFASCLAGFSQLTLVFGTAIVCYNINSDVYSNPIISSIFNMPLSLLGFMLIFFVLGFLIYAFLYAAIASTASKLEDINTSTMPVMFVFIIAFIGVMNAMTSGTIDSTMMKICSYIPFTAPMAMFTRIALSSVAWYEIVASIIVLTASVVGIGFISARIYRVGVLLYGMPPKFTNIIKMVFTGNGAKKGKISEKKDK